MFSFVDIIKNNTATFYRYDSDKVYSIRIRICLFVGVAALASIVFRNGMSGFLSEVLTIQSILVGFSFSVLFFLLSSGQLPEENKDGSIEYKLKAQRLNKLSRELFYNVSYFNLVAILCLISALLLLMPYPSSFVELLSRVVKGYLGPDIMPSLSLICEVVMDSIVGLLRAVFYFATLESMFTFVRTVGRVSYYFEKKLHL